MAEEAQKDAITLLFDGMRADAKNRGLTDPKYQLFIQETEAAFRARAAANPEFYKSVSDLMLHRKDAAKKLTNDILDIGKKAADSEIGSIGALDQGKSTTVGLANATNIETQGIVQKSRAGWSAFWGNIADFFDGIPGCDFITDFCRTREQRYAPKLIQADFSQNDAAKRTIGVDPKSAVGRAMSTFSAAIITTDNERVGLGSDDVVEANRRQDRMRDEVSRGAPVMIPPLPGASNNTSSNSGVHRSVGDIESFAKEVVAKLSNDSKLDQAKIEAITRGIVSADTLRGDKNGKISGDEGVALQKNAAYASLNDADKAKLNELLGIDKTGKVIAPAAPAPTLN